jgi:hypothetical protein
VVLASFDRNWSLALRNIGGGALYVCVTLALVRPLLLRLEKHLTKDGALTDSGLSVGLALMALGAWITDAIGEIVVSPPFEGLTLNLHGGMTRAPKPMDASQTALFEALRQTGALLGQTIAWSPSGGVCEGNNLHAAGLPNIDTLGVRGGLIHSPEEFAWPESFVERARLSTLMLCKIASGEIDAPRLKRLRLETL